MVVVHLEVPGAVELKVEAGVFGQRHEHVIEEADARARSTLTRAVEAKANGDAGLLGLTFKLDFAGTHGSSASSDSGETSTREAPARMSGPR